MEKTVEVIYISTGPYKSYAYEFFKSLKNLFPIYKKIVKVLTDDMSAIKELLEKISTEESQDLSYVELVKITDMPYPLINLAKFSYINDYIDDNTSYVFYFDADTICLEKSEEFWRNLENVLDSNKVILSPNVCFLMSFHPYRYSPEQRAGRIYDMELFKNRCEESESSILYNKLNIPDKSYVWSSTSLIAGTTSIMKRFAQKANARLQEVMINEGERGIPVYAIPRLFDESVANRMIYESYIGKDLEIEYYVKPYTSMEEQVMTPDYTFLLQKYGNGKYKKHS